MFAAAIFLYLDLDFVLEDLPVFLRKAIGLSSLSDVRVDRLKGCENLELLHGSIQLSDTGPYALEAVVE